MNARKTILSLAAAAALSISAFAQSGQPAAPAHNWTTDQILTATVHQAWIMSGRDENTFFEIVQQLAEISAQNRHLTLPDDATVGKRAGEYIKQQARADHDALLFAIVDKSVRMTGKPEAAQ